HAHGRMDPAFAVNLLRGGKGGARHGGGDGGRVFFTVFALVRLAHESSLWRVAGREGRIPGVSGPTSLRRYQPDQVLGSLRFRKSQSTSGGLPWLQGGKLHTLGRLPARVRCRRCPDWDDSRLSFANAGIQPKNRPAGKFNQDTAQ